MRIEGGDMKRGSPGRVTGFDVGSLGNQPTDLLDIPFQSRGMQA